MTSRRSHERARVTVLGSCGAYPEPGRACSGLLVEAGGSSLLLDLGYGALRELLEVRPEARPDAVVVTHEHPDHCLDLHGLFRMHHYDACTSPIPLYCAPAVLDRLAGIEPDVDLTAVFDHHALAGPIDLGWARLTTWELPHFVPDVGVRLEGRHGVIAYTGDTAPVPQLADLGRDADLFVVEATDRPGETEAPRRHLMTAREAGRTAAAAGARRLVLTHFWPGTDRAASVRAAGEEFDGQVIAAEEGLAITV